MPEFYFDAARRLMIYENLPEFARYEASKYIAEAQVVAGRFFVVPHNLRNCQVMRWLQHPVAPIITDANYEWPREPGLTPYESQKLTTNFMVLNPRSFVLSDMGTGKTLAALWAADWLMKQHPDKDFRALIVAPLSTLQRVWTDAIFKNFLSHRSVEILHGTADNRIKCLGKKADFYIINHDGIGVGAHTRKRIELDGFSRVLAERRDIRLIIVDEASAYKDAQTNRHKISRQVIGKKPYLWLMTGTPTPQAPTDAFGLAKLVNNAYGKSFTTFRNESMIKISNFKYVPTKDGYARVRHLLSPAIRFDITQVWDAPEMTTQQREVELSPEQKKLMAELKRNLQVSIKTGNPITAVSEGAARHKFIQVSLGAVYDETHKTHLVDASPRVNELKNIITEASGKLLLFASLTNVLTGLNNELKKAGHSCEIVNGSVSQKERSRIFQDFQDGDLRIIVADPGTMAHGLNLYAARTVIWYGPTEKTELYLQACKRAHRPGQKFPVTVVQLVSNALEREIFRRLEHNESLQGALLKLVQENKI